MKRILGFIMIITIGYSLIGQQIIGPSTVELNSPTIYQNRAGPCGVNCHYFWITDDGMIVSQNESSLEIYWTSPGYYIIELWIYVYSIGEQFFIEEIIVKAGNPIKIEYSYDATGNRYAREIIYLDPPSGGAKSAQKDDGSTATDTEIAHPLDGNLSVFPNPTEQQLQIIVNKEVLESQASILLFDNLGKQVLSMPITDYRNELDMSHLSNGIYILKLVYGNKHKEWKIIKN